MSHYSALLSIVFMMSFVMVFDQSHWRKIQKRLFRVDLLSPGEMDRVLLILSACQNS
jgi:hypothetical protein